MPVPARLLREPLVHFLGIGAALFVLYGALAGPAPAPPERILIEPGRIDHLAARFEAIWQRPPTDEETAALVEGFVREEVYYREALALGLDQDDPVIRRRLQQKLEFLTDSSADLIEPAPGDLEAYFEEHAESYRIPPRLAFEQLFLGQAPDPDRLADTLATLQADPDTAPDTLGETTLLPRRMALADPGAVDRQFGAGFFAALEALPEATWSGPIASSFGAHVVRITDTQAAGMPPFEAVKDEVLRQWRSEKADALREQVYAGFRERYDVVLPGDANVTTP